METIGTILGVTLVYVLKEFLVWYKAKLAIQKKPEDFIKAINVDVEINKTLEGLRLLVGANRVHILGYSNSVKTFAGTCYKFVSMMYERVDENTVPHMNEFQNAMASQFSELILKINNERFVYIPENEDSIIGKVHRQFGVVDAYKWRLGSTIANGSISVLYTRPHELTEGERGLIEDAIFRIETLLKLK